MYALLKHIYWLALSHVEHLFCILAAVPKHGFSGGITKHHDAADARH
jgi:hypothetical protein